MVAADVGQIAAPAVAAVVGMQAVAHRLIRGFLHRHVQRGVNAQALLVNRSGAVGVLEVLANFLDEIRREISCAAMAMCRPSGSVVRRLRPARARDFAVVGHQRQHQIAARQRALRMRQRRIDRPANYRGERRGFGQRQLPTGLLK